MTKVGFGGVLFDSGDTLIGPVGGRWNPRFDFEEILLRHLPELAVESFPPAFAAGQQVLDAGPTTPSLAEYHRAILGALGVRRLGLDTYFQAFVISAVLGCRKPDPRMYRAGSDALGLAPHECVFVDDAPELVAAAIELGYGGTAIVRTSDPPTAVPWISTLEDLVPMTGT